jgi:hypothetical protein
MQFFTKINADAPAGVFYLPVTLNYTYLDFADQYGVDMIQYFYKQKVENVTVPIKIKSELSVDVLSAIPEFLNVGTEGYIKMKIKNTGSEDGKKAIVKIVRNENSPIIPTDSSVYIGDFLTGQTAECRYKVSVSGDAERQSYPVDVIVVYQNTEGDFVTSRSDTIGIQVGGKVKFGITSPPVEMNPGNKKVINVEYKNTGDSAVYSAQSRISAIDPFTSSDDIAYLGDLKPGDSAIAAYEVSVNRAATIKEYGLDSEIQYRDTLDNTYISDTMKVNVNVVAPAGMSLVLQNPMYLSIILLVIIGSAYTIYHYWKK